MCSEKLSRHGKKNPILHICSLLVGHNERFLANQDPSESTPHVIDFLTRKNTDPK